MKYMTTITVIVQHLYCLSSLDLHLKIFISGVFVQRGCPPMRSS